MMTICNIETRHFFKLLLKIDRVVNCTSPKSVSNPIFRFNATIRFLLLGNLSYLCFNYCLVVPESQEDWADVCILTGCHFCAVLFLLSQRMFVPFYSVFLVVLNRS